MVYPSASDPGATADCRAAFYEYVGGQPRPGISSPSSGLISEQIQGFRADFVMLIQFDTPGRV